MAIRASSRSADVVEEKRFPVKPNVIRCFADADRRGQRRSSTYQTPHDEANDMSNEFRGIGNAGDDAALTTVIVANEEKQVAELRVYFDGHPSSHQSVAGKDGGFWLDVTVWGDRHAAEVAQHVKKGARVHVVGRLVEHRWTVTASGEMRSAMYLHADRVYLALTRIAEVKFDAPRRRFGEN